MRNLIPKTWITLAERYTHLDFWRQENAFGKSFLTLKNLFLVLDQHEILMEEIDGFEKSLYNRSFLFRNRIFCITTLWQYSSLPPDLSNSTRGWTHLTVTKQIIGKTNLWPKRKKGCWQISRSDRLDWYGLTHTEFKWWRPYQMALI
jgi:hypothetical protein